MSICESCVYGTCYDKPERPENGFACDIIGERKNSFLNRLFGGDEYVKVYRGGDLPYFYFDEKKYRYELEMDWHLHKVWCQAMPKAQQVYKHSVCSHYKEKE